MNENNPDLQFKVGDKVLIQMYSGQEQANFSTGVILNIKQSDAMLRYMVDVNDGCGHSDVSWYPPEMIFKYSEEENVEQSDDSKKPSLQFTAGDRVKAIRWVDSHINHMVWRHGTITTSSGSTAYNVKFDDKIENHNEWCCDHKYVLAPDKPIPEDHREEEREMKMEPKFSIGDKIEFLLYDDVWCPGTIVSVGILSYSIKSSDYSDLIYYRLKREVRAIQHNEQKLQIGENNMQKGYGKKKEITLKFNVGDHVWARTEEEECHPKWGRGVIVSIDEDDLGDLPYEVRFSNNHYTFWCGEENVRLQSPTEKEPTVNDNVKQEKSGNRFLDYTTACSGIITGWGMTKPGHDYTAEYQKDFAEQSPKPERSEGLIPNPCPTGRYYLPGTGHHFDHIGYVTVYYDEKHNAVNIDPQDEHQTALFKGYWTYSHFPTNLDTSGMNEEGLDLIQQMIIRRNYIKIPQYQNELKERRHKVWRKARRWGAIIVISSILFGATFDYKRGCMPRNWVKNMLTTVGHQLQSIGNGHGEK